MKYSQTPIPLLALLGGQAAVAQTVPNTPSPQRAVTGVAAPTNGIITTWSSPEPDAIDMHIVQTPEGLVLFDTLRRSDQVDDAVRLIERLGRPVRAIMLTHAHTDHYGGVPFLRNRYPDVPIYATEAIRDEIRDDVYPDNARRRALFGSRFATQETLNRHLPNRFVRDRRAITVAGLRIVPLVMGASESPAAMVYFLPDQNAAITGDLVNVLTISAPMVSLATWLEQLDRIERETRADTILHVGHGPSGPARSLIADQRTYLHTLDRLVRRAAADGQGVTGEETDAIVQAMREAYPHHGGAAFLPPEDLIREKRRMGRATDRR